LNIYIYKQYNPETARQNTSKLKHFIPIKKTKHLPKQNLEHCYNIQSFSLEKVLLMRTPIPFMSRTKPEFEAKASAC